jgi:RimJ/RimL family protein N-acetyltransferase
MIFPEKEIQLKDGRSALLRSPLPSDAEAALAYMKITAAETPFLLRTPEEVTLTVADEEKYLSRVAADENTVSIFCFVDGVLAGNCNISRKTKQKNRHRASIGIALKQEFWNLGIGTALFAEMIAIAECWGLVQLELEVIEGNDRAMGLYRKMGFETVSFVPNAIRMRDGSYVREFLMVKSLQK